MARSPRLSVDSIVDAAMTLVDENGLDGLSMRKLARRLDVEAMSLYHHVQSKEALLDLMVEQVFDGVGLNPSAEMWTDQLRAGMQSLRSSLLAHPNLLPVVATRPVMSRSTMAIVELALAELTRVGFTPDRARQVLNVLVSFAVGHALMEAGVSPMMFDGHDAETVASFRQSISGEDLPLVAQTIGMTPEDRESEFTLGVECLVAGIASELARGDSEASAHA